MKWALVLVGVSDFARPAESLSLTQNAALTTTGIIWTRWCLIIKPKNYLLAAVNFFLGCVGVIQCSRIFLHQQAQKKLQEEVGEAKEAVKEAKEAITHKSS
ncbi:mitochondrial pyruvate carrier [Cercophora samala]|uniref:Mitochondrial pyruvate carrier n=1 Tax=Cercophora samala TaxID=330535 RepID=A0AA39YMK9_9PEZI|nr:mitochondrial pyruvate carrier [Cercophora samala]